MKKVRSESYKNSPIPYLQRRLNTHFSQAGELRRTAAREEATRKSKEKYQKIQGFGVLKGCLCL